MGRGMTLAVLALAAGGAAYFAVMYVLTRITASRATNIERYTHAVEAAKRAETKVTIQQRLAQRLGDAGWYGSLAPLALATGFLYTVVVLVFTIIGLPGIFAVIIGLPACVGLVAAILGRVTARRRRLFQGQLMQALDQLASQLEAGNGPQRALEQIVGGLDDPLGAELAAALSASVATTDLVDALRTMEDRYPSRAMQLFLSALEIDRLQGGTLAPTLRQASTLLAKQFELAEETAAEVSQARLEFYTIVGIVGFIAFSLIAGSDSSARDAYLSPVGLVAMVGGVSWFGFGFWRGQRVFTKVRGDQL